MVLENSYNFRSIDSRITTSGQVRPEILEQVSSARCAVWINLLPASNEFAVPNEQAIIEAAGIRYISIPVNFDHPTLADWLQFCLAMREAEQANATIHVHCAANFRVTAFIGRYLMRQKKWTADQADALITELWSTSDYPAWATLLTHIDQHIADHA